LRRPRLKLQTRQIQEALAAIRKVAHFIMPTQTLSVSAHESDNRFLECAEAARADYLVTGNTRHFPQSHKTTKIVTGPLSPLPESHVAKHSIHGLSNAIFPCVINHIHNSANLLFDNLMVLLNREGSFHTESVPDGKLPAGNHRQSRCYCPLVASKG
jgi:hypothetical protein